MTTTGTSVLDRSSWGSLPMTPEWCLRPGAPTTMALGSCRRAAAAKPADGDDASTSSGRQAHPLRRRAASCAWPPNTREASPCLVGRRSTPAGGGASTRTTMSGAPEAAAQLTAAMAEVEPSNPTISGGYGRSQQRTRVRTHCRLGRASTGPFSRSESVRSVGRPALQPSRYLARCDRRRQRSSR